MAALDYQDVLPGGHCGRRPLKAPHTGATNLTGANRRQRCHKARGGLSGVSGAASL